jgi:hypothetical protein
MGTGSKIDQLYSDGRGSKLDQLYSDGGGDAATKQAARDRKQAAANNRHLRWASSHGDLRATLRLDENAKLPGNRNGGGVGDALENKSRDEKTGEARTREGLILEEQARKRAAAELGNNSPASPPVPVPGGSAAPAGGAGVAPTPSTGPSAPAPATTPPVAQGGAGNGKPVVPDWRDERKNAIDGKRKQFAIEKFGKDIIDWTVNDPEDQGKKSAQIFEDGKSLGISPEQIEAQANKAREEKEKEKKEKDVPIKKPNDITGVLQVDVVREGARKKAEEAISDFEKEKHSRSDSGIAFTKENYPDSFKDDEDNRKLVADQIEENVKNYIPPVDPKYQATPEQMSEPLTGSDTKMPIRTPTAEEIESERLSKSRADFKVKYPHLTDESLDATKALIPGARREIDSAINDAGEFNYKGEDLEKAKTLRGSKAPDDVSVNSKTAMLLKRHGKMTSQLQDIESRESAFFA